MKLRMINALKRREKKAKYEEEKRNSNTETSQSITKHASCRRCRHYDRYIIKQAIEYKDWSSTTIK